MADDGGRTSRDDSVGADIEADLHTVSVPEAIRPVFAHAQEFVRRYFAHRVEDPRRSTILISGERYILVRAASMSVEFMDMVVSLYKDRGEDEARTVANNLLFDMAHAIGKADARSFHARMGVEDPIERLSAGPIHFSFTGWAYVRILPESVASPDEKYCLVYDHLFSFESDSYLRQKRRSPSPVCIMNSGYSSGWCEESFGLPLVAVEVECQACGDEHCRFIMSPPSQIERHVAAYRAERREAAASRGPAPSIPMPIPEFFERKRMEESLRAANRELEQRVRERTEELEKANADLAAQLSELSRARRRQSSLMQELDHRVKNILTGVISIAESTLEGSKSLPQFREAFMGRLRAMAHVHESLSRSHWLGAEMADAAAIALRPFARPDGKGVRFDGPRVTLRPEAAGPLVMILHELATNAVKHGSLASPTGCVDFHWSVGSDDPDAPTLELHWRENGGSPASPPSREGYGLSLIRGLAEYELGGNAQMAFVHEGLVFKAVLPGAIRAES